MQFVVIGHDGTDEGALERRMAARDAHLALGDEYKENGHFLMAAALLNDEGEMCGSVMTVDFDSREALGAWLEKEPYVTDGVWKEVEVIPAKVGPNFMRE